MRLIIETVCTEFIETFYNYFNEVWFGKRKSSLKQNREREALCEQIIYQGWWIIYSHKGGEHKKMDNIIFLSEDGKPQKVKSDENAMLMLEAVRLALTHKSVQAQKKIININVRSKEKKSTITVDNIFDEKAPKEFSYLQSAVIAMAALKKKKMKMNAEDIAKSIIDQRNAYY